MSSMMRAPELTTISNSPVEILQVYSRVALIDEITYDYIVTKREEPLSIEVSVIGAPDVYF